jgi:hypothetical protein
MKQDCAVIVFAKAPVPGFAKTRLAPAIGEVAAARLASRMLDETLQQAVEADIGPVTLYCTPDESHPAFVEAKDRYGVDLALQGSGSLGVRMHCALDRALRSHARVLLIGTDAPELRADSLRIAAEALQSHPAVFVPVADGGFVLVGVSMRMPTLFDDIDWGTTKVMQQTRERLSTLKLAWHELPMLNDVDEPSDLAFVPPEWLI